MEGALDPGTVLVGKYRVESVLGRGGMGVVLRVTHLDLGESLAIKVLQPEGVAGAASAELTARFLREARSVVRLRGEHVAKVTDVGVLPEGLPFMVMEYLRGVDLADEIKRRKQLPLGETVDYLLQVCEALAEAHAHGIVHRDIKPANLFLTTRPDGTPLVKVLDFGISKAPVTAAGLVTQTNIVMGTAGYMSPEHMKAAKDVDGRTDIWALGIVLYECLSGRRPFEGASFSAVVLKVGTEPPPPMDARIPRGLQDIVLKCLEKDRGARFATVAELATALAPFARDQRAAATIVDRANLIRQRPGSSNELPPFIDLSAEPAVDDDPSSVSSAPSSVSSAPTLSRRKRYGRAGVAVLFGLVAVAAVAVLSRSGSARSPGEPAGQPGSAGAGRPEHAITAAPDAPPATVTPSPGDQRTPLMVCADLEEQKRWHDLLQCTVTLEARGFTDQARAFRGKASEETQNEAIDGNVRRELRDGELKLAQGALKQMTADSVYLKALTDAFDRADARNVEDAGRKAKGYASAHDCEGLTRYLGQLSSSATGTDRAIAAVKEAAARCMEPPRQDPAGAGQPPGTGSEAPVPPAPAPR
jgi:serine/threonine-protein kinase